MTAAENGIHSTRPPQARQDAPLPELRSQSRSSLRHTPVGKELSWRARGWAGDMSTPHLARSLRPRWTTISSSLTLKAILNKPGN
jgi:hypothetical protein